MRGRVHCPPNPASQRGLSLVELMVGIAVGLFIVAGAIVVVTTQLGDNRRLLLETQVHQDMRATADIITRELRRAGAEDDAASHVWSAAGSASSAHATVKLNADFNQVEFEYVRAANPGPWGFRLQRNVVGGVERGVIQTRLATGGGWQDLTDSNAIDVTGFRVEPIAALTFTETLPCARTCPTPLTAVIPPDTAETWCWPTLEVRTYEIEIKARAVSDERVQREIRSTVRLRNDRLGFDPDLSPNQACP